MLAVEFGMVPREGGLRNLTVRASFEVLIVIGIAPIRKIFSPKRRPELEPLRNAVVGVDVLPVAKAAGRKDTVRPKPILYFQNLRRALFGVHGISILDVDVIDVDHVTRR